METKEKPCSESRAIKTTHIFPPDTNANGTLFGGKLMAHIDDLAAIAARKHAREQVVTASTDSVDFLAPITLGDFMTLEAFVTWTHRTSMEVFVKVEVEEMETGKKTICGTAFLTFVAVDEKAKPIPVPAVYPETEQEKALHEGAEERAKQRQARRKQSKAMAERFKYLQGND